MSKESKETYLVQQVMDKELTIGKANTQTIISDYESYEDMLEAERTEKNADWMSDIFIPEFPAQILAQSSEEANQYFKTRDFVEVYLEDEDETSINAAEASKECINRTLNQKHLHFYQKFMRANITKNIANEVYIQCIWERESKKQNVPVKKVGRSNDLDINGFPLVDRSIQEPAVVEFEELEEQEMITKDRFNFDIVDRRNVFTDNTYSYSIQDKKWIIIRDEKTLDELRSEADREDYINLDELEEINPDIETKTSQESYNKEGKYQKVKQEKDMPYDIYHRYGKYWSIIKSVDRFGNPTEVDMGIDDNGDVLDGAELVECIVSIAESGSTRQLIRFIPLPYITKEGTPYRNLIRGLCYIHPSKDGGLGDGKYARELQIAINDTFNISNDRVMLATLPTLKGKRNDIEDNTQIYFEPMHVIPVDEPNDLTEFVVQDNVDGALRQIGVLTQAMSKVTSKFGPQLGGVPELASTTATAVAGAEASSNKRDNYKALTFEHTALVPFYDMIQQLTWQYATEDTGFKLMGDKLVNFDPAKDFTYKPLSQSIESEYSKANQIRELNQMMSVLAPVVQINPKGAQLINMIVARIFKLFGDEYVNFADALLDEKAPVGAQTGTNQPIPAQNQTGLPQGGVEQGVRA